MGRRPKQIDTGSQLTIVAPEIDLARVTAERDGLLSLLFGLLAHFRKREPEADPLSQHPAIKAMRGVLRKYPSRELWPDLAKALGDQPNFERLLRCRKEWLAIGFNPQSYKWLAWYRPGVLEEILDEQKARAASGGKRASEDKFSGAIGGTAAYLERLAADDHEDEIQDAPH